MTWKVPGTLQNMVSWNNVDRMQELEQPKVVVKALVLIHEINEKESFGGDCVKLQWIVDLFIWIILWEYVIIMLCYKSKMHKYAKKLDSELNKLKNYNIIIKSDYNDYIHVKTYNNGLSKMWFSKDKNEQDTNMFQSMYNANDLEKIHLTYIYPLLTCLVYCNKLNNSLMIGLGGGHIPLFIKEKYPNINIEVVEIDEKVAIASENMGMRVIDGLTICIDDGINFLKNNTNKYDLVIIDLDSEESILKFNFDKIVYSVDDNGILAINSFTYNQTLLPNILKKYFVCIKHFKLHTNNVFICSKEKSKYEQMNKKISIEMISNIFIKHQQEFVSSVNSINYNML